MLQRARVLIQDHEDAWIVNEAWWLEVSRKDQNESTSTLRIEGA